MGLDLDKAAAAVLITQRDDAKDARPIAQAMPGRQLGTGAHHDAMRHGSAAAVGDHIAARDRWGRQVKAGIFGALLVLPAIAYVVEMVDQRRVTAEYLIREEQSAPGSLPMTVRIRTLLHDRCVTCHGEKGRHDIARFIELDTYEGLAPHLKPEPDASTASRAWLIAVLVSLYPLAAFTGSLFLITNHPSGAKRVVFRFIAPKKPTDAAVLLYCR